MLIRLERVLLIVAALIPALTSSPVLAAEIAATIRVDATAPTGNASAAPSLPADRENWTRWARLDRGKTLATTVSPTLPVTASRFPGGAGLAVTNDTENTARLRVEIRLPGGLWRFEGVLVPPAADEENGIRARSWRMESVLLPKAGNAVKALTLPPGHTLLVRVTETCAAAQAAYREAAAVRERAGTDYLRGRVGRPLRTVASVVNSLPGLVAKGKRADAAKKAHKALLAAAQAQAVWKNGRGAALADHDGAFDDLMAALSEVSCAAYNLVPAQTEIVAADGSRTLRLTLTNAGTRPFPVVSLGVQEPGADAEATTDALQRAVFTSLAPGERVQATFRAKEPATQGIVQWVVGMGAAVVSAAPMP